MFCPNCGKQLGDNAKFCTGCGKSMEKPAQAAPQPTPAAPVYKQPAPPVYTPAPAPKKPGSKKWIPIIAIIAAVVILLGAIVGLLLSGVLTGNKGKVMSAFAKSASAFASVADEADLPKADFIPESGAVSQSLSLGVNSMPEVPELEMIDLQLNVDSNIEGRELYIDVLPTVGSVDLFQAQVALEDNMLLVSAPKLIGDRVYGFDTMTFGSDLYELGGMDEEFASLGFNVYDILEMVKNFATPDEDAKKELTKAAAALVDAIEVEKLGKEEIEVNDNKVKAVGYSVVIPEDALDDLFDAVMDVYSTGDPVELLTDILYSLGLSNEMVEEALWSMDMEGMDISGTVEDGYKYILRELGDIELEVYIAKGYIQAINWEISIEGTDLELRAEIGNKENYLNAITLLLDVDGMAEIELRSEGNHVFKDKEFTDSTTVEVSGSGIDSVRVSMETVYAPEKNSDNFEWSFSAADVRMSIEGQITAEKDSFQADLSSIKLNAYGEDLIRLSAAYTAQAYTPGGIHADDAIELLKMPPEKMMAEAEDLMVIVEEKVMNLMEQNPEVFDMIEDMM